MKTKIKEVMDSLNDIHVIDEQGNKKDVPHLYCSNERFEYLISYSNIYDKLPIITLDQSKFVSNAINQCVIGITNAKVMIYELGIWSKSQEYSGQILEQLLSKDTKGITIISGTKTEKISSHTYTCWKLQLSQTL